MCYIATVAETGGPDRHVKNVVSRFGLLTLSESSSPEGIQIRVAEISV
jgi:hypothetical protein